MYVSKLTLSNFRNYGEQTLELNNGLNIVYGANAEGKTNLLESIYVMSVGKSPRAVKDRELIKWGEDAAYIRADIVKKYAGHKIEIYIDSSRKRIAVDGLPVARIGELMGTLNVVYFSPDELRIIKQSPNERRRFIDISLAQQSKLYYYTLVRYNKVLAARNKLLKDGRDVSSTLPVWDEQLAQYGAGLIYMRRQYVNMLAEYARTKHESLSLGRERLDITYDTQCDGESQDELREQLLALYKAGADRDIRLYYTTNGPHRDDMVIRADGIDLRKYGSQGQQRTAALSLKLAELQVFKANTGEYPVLLLDDVLSELDSDRRRALMQSTEGVQTVLTCTEYDLETGGAAMYSVKDGRAVRQRI